MYDLAEFLVGSVGLGQLQVVAYAAAHQRVALRNEAQVALHRYFSARWLYKAKNQTEKGRLANARLAHDGRLRACLEVVTKVRQDFPVAFGIAEAHVFEADVSRVLLMRIGCLQSLRLVFQISSSRYFL